MMNKYDIDESLIGNSKDSLMTFMYKMNKNTNGIVFVLDEEGKFRGVITDGDIKRALMTGHTLNEMVEPFINTASITVTAEEPEASVERKFAGKVCIIPIIDKEQKVVGFYKKKASMPIADPQLNGNELNYLLDAFVSTWISSSGYYINRFEEDFSAFCDSQYGIAVSNGTVALHLALVALGIKAGDEVIVPDLTFAATINAVLHTGATPVIVDIEENSWCIDPKEIEKAVTPRTKAIIPVHIYGQPCDMDAICAIAKEHNLYIIEDCAEAHGALYKGRKVGSFGDVGCFSFFGNKVITTGEGGMCVTSSEELSNLMRKLRDHGMSKERRYYHEVVGYNYRMTNLQAAIGVGQLEKIDAILNWREELEEKYRNMLAGIPSITLQRKDLPERKKVAWLVSILVEADKRDTFMAEMKQRGIDSRAFFIPLSQMDIYRPYARECKVSNQISQMGINLPTNYRVDEGIIRKIAEIAKAW